MQKIRQCTIDDDGVRSIIDEGARVALVTVLMQSFAAKVYNQVSCFVALGLL
jgi:hypothetical protein